MLTFCETGQQSLMARSCGASEQVGKRLNPQGFAILSDVPVEQVPATLHLATLDRWPSAPMDNDTFSMRLALNRQSLSWGREVIRWKEQKGLLGSMVGSGRDEGMSLDGLRVMV
jgi:hypothetical protein